MIDEGYVDYNWCPACGEMRGVCDCDDLAKEDDIIQRDIRVLMEVLDEMQRQVTLCDSGKQAGSGQTDRQRGRVQCGADHR